MTTHNRKVTKGAVRLVAMIGVLLTGLFAFAAWEQMVQAASATPAADVTVFDLATGRTTTIAAGNAPREVVVQQTAATTTEAGAKVSIVNFAFTPGEITIAPGESVTWTNDDGAPHGLEYHDGAKGTDLLLPGASFSRRFDRPGTYDYNCSIHPYMTGRVVVRAQ
jgi:plastocyanin